MNNSYFIAFCVIVLLAFIFLIYMSGDLFYNKRLSTENEVLFENGTLNKQTNIKESENWNL
jgi:hypothetical protein